MAIFSTNFLFKTHFKKPTASNSRSGFLRGFLRSGFSMTYYKLFKIFVKFYIYILKHETMIPATELLLQKYYF